MKNENGDQISPVQMPVEFHILFSIIKASTANQGKRKHMSILSVFIWQLIKAIFLFSFVIFFDMGVTVFQFTFQPYIP